MTIPPDELRALVRERLGPLLVRETDTSNWSSVAIQIEAGNIRAERQHNHALHAAARALLGVPADQPSPLEDTDAD